MSQELNTDLEHSRLLKETGIKFAADGFWISLDNGDTWFWTSAYVSDPDKLIISSARIDKIREKFPEWCLYKTYLVETNGDISLYNPYLFDEFSKQGKWELVVRIGFLSTEIIESRGQAAANAAAKLLHLLWKEELI